MTVIDRPAITPAGHAEPGEVGAFADRVLGALLGAQEIQALYLGDRLGWYRALAGNALTPGELASVTGTAERYAREWLEHQAAAGYLTVDSPGAAPRERRYALPAAHAAVLVDEDSLAYLAPVGRMAAATGRVLDRLADAYRTGGGVSWDELGDDARDAQAALNRPLFLRQLGQELLPAAPEVHARLQRAARIADVGCGYGWSSIGLARAYPAAQVDGFDLDEPSVERARRHAADAGLGERVRFHAADAAAPAQGGSYDAVFAFECVHDMSDPVAALASMREMVAPDGLVIVMDERTEEQFTAPAGQGERLLYGFSLTCCLPGGLSEQPSAGTGTVMRPITLAGYARRAGYSDFEVLPIEHEVFRFYRLHP